MYRSIHTCTNGVRVLFGLSLMALAFASAAGQQPARKAPSPAKSHVTAAKVFTDPDGVRYTIKKLRKQDIKFHKLENDRVRVLPYFQYRLAREDKNYLYVKEYLIVDSTTQKAPELTKPVPEPVITTGSVDRLQFNAFDSGLPTKGQWRNNFEIADLNRDGHWDIIHGPPRKGGGGGPRVFLGDSAGHWRLWTEAVYPPASYDYGAIAVADFDADGHLDLALGAHLKGISIMLGDGAGRFRLVAKPGDLEPNPQNRFTSRAILAHDWNRDGKPDIIALGEGPGRNPTGMISSLGWAMYINQGAKGWQKLAQNATQARVFGDSLAVGDVNGDGAGDLVTASSVSNNRQVLHFGGAVAKTVALELSAASSYINTVTMADFDGDQRADIATGYLQFAGKIRRTLIEVLRLGANGIWQRQTVYTNDNGSNIYALAAGDADGDGRQDLVAADDAGTLRLFLGDGKGGFEQEQTPELTSFGKGCRGYHVRLADLDGDHRAELIAAFASEYSPSSGQPGCPNDGRLAAWKPVPKN